MITCPCCRATNDAGPACRRCKADLGFLFAIVARRADLMSAARRAVAVGDWPTVTKTAGAADHLRAGVDARRLLAVAALMSRDYPAARAWYTAASAVSEPRAGA